MAGKRILIVDDDEELCEELADALRDEGYPVDYVGDALKGEDRIKNGAYEVILLDYKMSGGGGLDILKNLKNAGLKKEIFMMTGRPFVEKELQDKNLRDMVTGIIGKPIRFEEFLETILKNIKE